MIYSRTSISKIILRGDIALYARMVVTIVTSKGVSYPLIGWNVVLYVLYELVAVTRHDDLRGRKPYALKDCFTDTFSVFVVDGVDRIVENNYWRVNA